MKKIIVSAFTIFAVVAMVAGATQAVFSDTSSFDGNTIATATVDIDAKSEQKQADLPKPLVVSRLIPGEWTGWARGVVFNKPSSTPVKVFMYVDNVSGDACSKTNLTVYTGHAANGAASERSHKIYDGPLNGLKGNSKRREVTGRIGDLLGVNNSAVIQQRAQLDESAGNNLQHTSCTWNEVFVAETPVEASEE